MEILLKYFPGLSPLQLNQYQRLHELVLTWNRRINLVSRKDSEHLPERHILHSLGFAGHARFSPEDTVLDVGTGGGFPGLPLAVFFPETRFILIDSVGKKIKAVNEISRGIGLQNVDCRQVRAEDFKGKVSHIVSRAVTGLERFTGWIAENLPGDPGSSEGRISGRHGAGPGVWYLKGGDIEKELAPFPGAVVFELKAQFTEPFFETKKLVWLPAESLK